MEADYFLRALTSGLRGRMPSSMKSQILSAIRRGDNFPSGEYQNTVRMIRLAIGSI